MLKSKYIKPATFFNNVLTESILEVIVTSVKTNNGITYGDGGTEPPRVKGRRGDEDISDEELEGLFEIMASDSTSVLW